MKIQFINHASFVIENNNISILSDLWMEGKIFNNAWNLISPTKLKYTDFDQINYIWFSHEHPDHFSPNNLQKIPKEYKAKIAILYQETIDKQVVNYCSKGDFKFCRELKKGEHFIIDDAFEILCEPASEGDSWAYYKVGEVGILNTNDCAIRTTEEANDIKNRVGNIDVLLTKYSYASWSGNPSDYNLRKEIATQKLELLKLQVEIFAPSITIPIASQFYFCHEENYFLNDLINTPETVYRFLNENTDSTPIILYPGDEYQPYQNFDSLASIEKYKRDYEKISPSKIDRSTLEKSKKVSVADLVLLSKSYINSLNTIVKSVPFLEDFIKDVKIFLWDFGTSFSLSLIEGLTANITSYDECDVAISSDSLRYCFEHSFGFETVRIGARLQKPIRGDFAKFYNFFRTAMLIDKGDVIAINKYKKLKF